MRTSYESNDIFDIIRKENILYHLKYLFNSEVTSWKKNICFCKSLVMQKCNNLGNLDPRSRGKKMMLFIVSTLATYYTLICLNDTLLAYAYNSRFNRCHISQYLMSLDASAAREWKDEWIEKLYLFVFRSRIARNKSNHRFVKQFLSLIMD